MSMDYVQNITCSMLAVCIFCLQKCSQIFPSSLPLLPVLNYKYGLSHALGNMYSEG